MAEGFITRKGGAGAEPTPIENYINATGGFSIAEYEENGKWYRSHTFLNSGNFVVTQVGDVAGDRNKVDYLIVAGGGGANNHVGCGGSGGGGGAGGFRTTVGTSGGNSPAESKITVSTQTYPVIVGAGGPGMDFPANVESLADHVFPGQNGSNSGVFGVTSLGGGGASDWNIKANDGGSGGGAGNSQLSAGKVAGSGTTGQGFNGGSGGSYSSVSGGGGGGAGQAGENGTTSGADGGDGLPTTIRNGNIEYYAGGGGSAAVGSSSNVGIGGLGGGGNGGTESSFKGQNGQAATGGGAGGSRNDCQSNVTYLVAASGGSGIVIIRYEIAPKS